MRQDLCGRRTERCARGNRRGFAAPRQTIPGAHRRYSNGTVPRFESATASQRLESALYPEFRLEGLCGSRIRAKVTESCRFYGRSARPDLRHSPRVTVAVTTHA